MVHFLVFFIQMKKKEEFIMIFHLPSFQLIKTNLGYFVWV
jgi:hypothetical protein